MALPTPKLDDRSFQDLVDEAKRLIPKYCPGWTDHNVSDPGITLIELFAYMTEQYLYRLNQVPDKNYIAFLNLLGIKLEPPRAACGAVTFTLTQALDLDATFNIPKGTEIATERTATEEAVVFTTDREAQVEGARLQTILTTTHVEVENAGWEDHSQVLTTRSPFDGWPTDPVLFETKDSLPAFSVDAKFKTYLKGMILSADFWQEFAKQHINLFNDRFFTITEEQIDTKWRIVVAGKQTFIVSKDKDALKITLEPASISGNLDTKVLAPALRQAFEKHSIRLSDDKSITITQEKPGSLWQIEDAGQQTFVVSKEEQNLKISKEPKPAFLLGFENDLSAHTLAVTIKCEEIGAAALWEVYSIVPSAGDAQRAGWVAIAVAAGGDQGLGATAVTLYLPDNCQSLQVGKWQAKTWLRCSPDPGKPADTSAKILSIQVETLGVTVPITHSLTVGPEMMGISDGQPAQRFFLMNRPILPPSEPNEVVEVEDAQGKWKAWTQRPDFGDAVDERGPKLHYVIDPVAGLVEFGPRIRQLNGEELSFGEIPPRGQRIRIRSYRVGGGIRGAIGVGTVSVLKSTIPYVRDVSNLAPIMGGKDAQTLEEAKLRAPARLRTRDRAVTGGDFEYWAQQVPGVGRVHCVRREAVTNPAEEGAATQPEPGVVKLLIIPGPTSFDKANLEKHIDTRRKTLRAPALEALALKLMLSEPHEQPQMIKEFAQEFMRNEAIKQNMMSEESAPEFMRSEDSRQSKMIEEFSQEFMLSEALKQRIDQALSPRRLLTTVLQIDKPTYIGVRLGIDVMSTPRVNRERVKQDVEYALYHWLHPLYGGDDGKGWPLGRAVTIDRIYAIVNNTAGVEYAIEAKLYVFENGKWGTPKTSTGRLSHDIVEIPPLAVVNSGSHLINVKN